MKKHYNIPIFIPHLGCPNACAFCNQRTISGHGDYDFSAVKEELDRAFATTDDRIPTQIAYFGGSFTGIPKEEMLRLLSLAGEYIEAGRCESIRISTRPDYIDEEVLEILRAYHVRTIELGIQSMSDAVLACSRRGHSAADTRRAASLVRAFGFELVGQMMVGLPGSDVTLETMTAREICDMGASGARIYPTVVFRGTELAERMARGEYTPLSREEAVTRSAAALAVFVRYGVPVIRIGLPSSEALADDAQALGGGYHPAVGELAWARYFRGELERLLACQNAAGRFIEIETAPCDLSKAIGQHGENRAYLKAKFSLEGLRFLSNPDVPSGSFRIRKAMVQGVPSENIG